MASKICKSMLPTEVEYMFNKNMVLLFQYHVIFSLILYLVSSASLSPPAIYLLRFLDSLPKHTQLLLSTNPILQSLIANGKECLATPKRVFRSEP
ncbi:hypothetical protein CRYUN_Cryun19dG0097200 [Craigia yunnanensis]